MTAEEKIQDSSQRLPADPDSIESTDWHEDDLRIREARVASGEEKLIDWNRAKAEIRRLTS